MKTILVTGGMGYIGIHTINEILNFGYEIIILDSLRNSSKDALEDLERIEASQNKLHLFKKIKFYKADICNKYEIETLFERQLQANSPIDAVMHFAGLKSVPESIKNPFLYWKINVGGSINLFDSMKKFNCNKIVFSSSASVYGERDDNLLNENMIMNPSSTYGMTKSYVENILSDLSNNENWKVINLRFFNPIGAHDSGNLGENPKNSKYLNIFPLICEVAARKRKEIEIFGNDWPTYDGTQIRDYIHIMDLAEIHAKCLELLFLNEKKSNISINVGDGKGISVLELIKIFEESNKIKIGLSFREKRENDVCRLVANNALCKSLFQWEPRRSIRDACLDGYRWYKYKNKII